MTLGGSAYGSVAWYTARTCQAEVQHVKENYTGPGAHHLRSVKSWLEFGAVGGLTTAALLGQGLLFPRYAALE